MLAPLHFVFLRPFFGARSCKQLQNSGQSMSMGNRSRKMRRVSAGAYVRLEKRCMWCLFFRLLFYNLAYQIAVRDLYFQIVLKTLPLH